MASLVNEVTTINEAVQIPEFWSKFVVEFREANLVAAKFFMDFSSDVSEGGDTIHIPESLTKQTPADFTQGQRLTDKLISDTESEVTIDLDRYKVNPFVISDMAQRQSIFRAKALRMKKAAYAIAKEIDTRVLSHASAFTTSVVNNGGTSISNKDLTEAWARLNSNDVPMTDRQYFMTPFSIKDLFDLTGNYFTSVDFSEGKGLVNGQIGMLLNSPVAVSTNLTSTSAGSPANALRTNVYAHKEAIAQAYQWKPEVQQSAAGDGLSIDLQGQLCNVRSLYGSSLLRSDHGVRIMRQEA